MRRTILIGPAATLFLSLLVAQAGLLVLTPILPEVAREFGVSTATAGGLRIFSGVAGGVTALVLATVGRRLGLRDLIASGVALVGLGSLGSAAAPSFAALAVAQVAVGSGAAAVLSAGVAAASRWAGPSERARVLSWALLGQPAAWVIGMPVIGALSDLSWRYSFLAAPAVASALALLALATRPGDAPSAASGSIWPVLRREPAIAGWAVGELLAYAAWGGTLTFSGALLVESYDASASLTGALLAAAAVAYFPGTLLARRRIADQSRQLLVRLGIGLAGLIALFGTLRPALWVSAALFALAVLLCGGRTIAGSAVGLDTAPEHQVATMSIRAAATQFGYLLGAAAGGVALAAGGYPLLGAVLASLFVGGVVPHLVAAVTSRVTIDDAAISRERPQEA